MADIELFTLLNRNADSPYDTEHLDGNAIIELLQQYPKAAARKYNFTRSGGRYYPLHQAVRLGAGIDVLETIHNSHPPAVRESCEDHTALSLSIQHVAPTEVVLFLIRKWPEAVREKGSSANTLLHWACYHNLSDKVLSSLLEICPDAARARNDDDEAPLHMAFRTRIPPLKNISLLLDHHPGVVKEQGNRGYTPLHYAARFDNIPLEMILLFLEKWPYAVMARDWDNMTPLDWYKLRIGNEDVYHVLSSVNQLCGKDTLGNVELKEMMDFFSGIEWWNGILIIIDRYPALLKEFHINFKCFPELFHAIGHRCMMKTMWKVVENELDVMEGV